MNIGRFFRHISTGRRAIRGRFSPMAMKNIEEAIKKSEKRHRGEIQFAVEAGLHGWQVRRGMSARDRAVEVFSQLRIWDTEENTGVLIYLLLADRDIEIIADRGINRAAGTAVWDKICRDMETKFRASAFEEGVVHGINEITAVLEKHFPWRAGDSNELANKPVVL